MFVNHRTCTNAVYGRNITKQFFGLDAELESGHVHNDIILVVTKGSGKIILCRKAFDETDGYVVAPNHSRLTIVPAQESKNTLRSGGARSVASRNYFYSVPAVSGRVSPRSRVCDDGINLVRYSREYKINFITNGHR